MVFFRQPIIALQHKFWNPCVSGKTRLSFPLVVLVCIAINVDYVNSLVFTPIRSDTYLYIGS